MAGFHLPITGWFYLPTDTQAAALRALRIAQAQSTATRDNHQANSEHDLAILAMTAENLAAPHFSMITWQAAQTATQTGKFQGAPARAWDEPAAPATSPAGPAPSLPRTPFLPNPSTPTARPQIQPISSMSIPFAQDDGHTHRLPLPGEVAGNVNPDGFFSRHLSHNYDPARSPAPLAVQLDTDAIPGMGKLREVLLTPTALADGQAGAIALILVLASGNDQPDVLTVDPNWTEEDVLRVAYQLTTGGKAGPLTSDQRLIFDRYVTAILEAITWQKQAQIEEQRAAQQQREDNLQSLSAPGLLPAYKPSGDPIADAERQRRTNEFLQGLANRGINVDQWLREQQAIAVQKGIETQRAEYNQLLAESQDRRLRALADMKSDEMALIGVLVGMMEIGQVVRAIAPF